MSNSNNEQNFKLDELEKPLTEKEMKEATEGLAEARGGALIANVIANTPPPKPNRRRR
ncbi:hypothetical protein [Paenibacillus radicis (ex Xue et al. 2023)]|uniref:Bacteriocin n=1 Tax=Paenibacillus radicis (ex Xue et al. 2023) TaxID=2972489 RepID=A0ABT1YU38_9BACL|nr:hypothetical protein [Paenibacillus radicis (ex Xue et al. 2023)]MCR8636709.1 hypothetical protein [Paenibacillus radicis (ex Xue et al. 2023)]